MRLLAVIDEVDEADCAGASLSVPSPWRWPGTAAAQRTSGGLWSTPPSRRLSWAACWIALYCLALSVVDISHNAAAHQARWCRCHGKASPGLGAGRADEGGYLV